MAFKPKPERVLHLETLLNGYRLNIDPLPREQAEKLGDSPDMVRVHLCTLHLPLLSHYEDWMVQQLGGVCHMEMKKIRSGLAKLHRKNVDELYPWLQNS